MKKRDGKSLEGKKVNFFIFIFFFVNTHQSDVYNGGYYFGIWKTTIQVDNRIRKEDENRTLRIP